MLALRRLLSRGGVTKTFSATRCLTYEQGQCPDDPRFREYFYFIDHQGQLFLDDSKMKNFTSCFKEKDFLVFFFKRIKTNSGGKYSDEFPYISPCGREKNYVRCDDTPIVFTHIIEGSPATGKPDQLSYGRAGDRMTLTFEPENVCMLPDTGRVYHPAPEKYGSIGLIKSSLAIEMSKDFEFESGNEMMPPSHFSWRGTRYTLTNTLLDKIATEESLNNKLK